MRNLNAFEQTVFSRYMLRNAKRVHIAFILWLFFGIFGVHRFYLGKKLTGFIILFLTLISLGLFGIIGIIDGLNVKRLVKEYNEKVYLQAIKEAKNS